ncbi:MAG: transposase, partial [Chloroflexota bacterium]|nr:transposase [Chloroflexota bacterium]
MSLPDAALLEGFSLAELRDLVGALVAEVRTLRSGAEAQQATIVALRTENQALRDEVARLKGLPPRPPSRPSGMEQATQPEAAGKDEKRPKPPRGVKRDAQAITAERVLKVAVPAGSRFKGYEDILVRDLHLSAEVVRYRRERWVLPSGETVLAPLPAGIVGGFGPELRRFALALHAQGQVTTERLVALLNGIGVEISKRQVVRLLTEPLDEFVAEDQEVLRAGLATACWVSVDDTAARHARKDGFTTQIGDDRFTVFRTGASKSREAFLSVLRAGYNDYVVNAAALEYMRGHSLSGQVIGLLDAHPVKQFADTSAWSAHLARLGIDHLAVTPDPVQIASEGALWGAVCHHGLLPGTVIVSGDAGQFRVGNHALCWVHAERLVHKLLPATPEQRRAVELVRALIWWFYADLKAWKRDPCPRRAAALRARFDRIFRRRTGYVVLDRLLARLHRRKPKLLRVLQHSVIPLHTNGSENDIRACVTKRKISGGT